MPVVAIITLANIIDYLTAESSDQLNAIKAISIVTAFKRLIIFGYSDFTIETLKFGLTKKAIDYRTQRKNE